MDITPGLLKLHPCVFYTKCSRCGAEPGIRCKSQIQMGRHCKVHLARVTSFNVWLASIGVSNPGYSIYIVWGSGALYKEITEVVAGIKVRESQLAESKTT